MATMYLMMFLIVIIAIIYKSKSIRRICNRRRNRRRRKPKTYYYLNKSAAENAENNVIDPLIGPANGNGGIQLSTDSRRAKKGQRKDKSGDRTDSKLIDTSVMHNDLSMMAAESSFDERHYKSGSSYQVGEVDENGFVCIGIEERKVPPSTE